MDESIVSKRGETKRVAQFLNFTDRKANCVHPDQMAHDNDEFRFNDTSTHEGHL